MTTLLCKILLLKNTKALTLTFQGRMWRKNACFVIDHDLIISLQGQCIELRLIDNAIHCHAFGKNAYQTP
jgi:hypothetical protein